MELILQLFTSINIIEPIIVEWKRLKPQNEKERFEILQSMIAHSQYCLAGNTNTNTNTYINT